MNLWGLPPSKIFKEILANFAMGIPFIRSCRLKRARTSNTSVNLEAQKILSEFDFFISSSGDVAGKVILEIGPGDAVGLAPLFIAAGAKRYLIVDRFCGDIYGGHALALYEELSRLRGPFPINWHRQVEQINVSIENPIPEKLTVDLIISFDVIEHITNVGGAIRNMVAMLGVNGLMIHRIDYGPHGIWRSTPSPLDFLSVPPVLWDIMGSNRGYPNRIRHGDFVKIIRDHGLNIAVRITKTLANNVLDAEVICGVQENLFLGNSFDQNTAYKRI